MNLIHTPDADGTCPAFCPYELRLMAEGWTEQEVRRLHSYTEEANPELSEERALALMATLHKRVKARLM